MKFKYDFITHLGLFIIYNLPFIIVYIVSMLVFQNLQLEKLNNYFWNGELFYYFPAKWIHLLINCYIFYLVKFKIM